MAEERRRSRRHLHDMRRGSGGVTRISGIALRVKAKILSLAY